MVYESDITIIGGGVIGLAVAAQVADEDRDVYVLEKNETFGQETSSRTSEVIHAGIYYPEGSLKAKTCVEGNALLYELCRKYGINHKRIGKLIVAVNGAESEQLENLLAQGAKNGVRDLKMLSKREIEQIEPNVKAVAAILSPSTGIIDSHALMGYFVGKARGKGVKIVFKSRVIGIKRVSDGYKVTTEDSSGTFSFKTRILINCAGLSSDGIADLAGIDIIEAGYKLHYCKGEYFSVCSGKSRLITRLVYPVPQPKSTGLGIHATFDLGGRMRLGPGARYINKIDYAVDESQKRAFYESVRSFLPFIEYNDLGPEMAGIRPKLQEPGGDFRDFVIKHEHDKGLPGLIDLIGIESPGLTSSPAIAKYIEGMVKEIL